jgi:hypothetical protein
MELGHPQESLHLVPRFKVKRILLFLGTETARRLGRGCGGQTFENLAAAGLFGTSAFLQGGFEDALHVSQVLHPLLHVGKALFDEYLNFLAARARSVAKEEQGGNIFERKAGGLGRTDEPQPLDGLCPIEPVVALAPAFGMDEADALIVANRRGRDARNMGQLADGVPRAHVRHGSQL